MSKRLMNDDQWLNMLQECRSSGLTDRAWCAIQGIHPTTFYRAIKRLRQKACAIPVRNTDAGSLPQEIVEIATVDENGVIVQAHHTEATPLPNDQSYIPSENGINSHAFETSVRIVMPSGIKIELCNSTNAATIRNILDVLQAV
nr:hypothetical protein [Clostridia bacterium]